MISFQYKTAKNQFYLLMMLIVNNTLLKLWDLRFSPRLISNKIDIIIRYLLCCVIVLKHPLPKCLKRLLNIKALGAFNKEGLSTVKLCAGC